MLSARLLFLFACLLVSLRAVADPSSLRIHGSNTIGEHLAPALLAAWRESMDADALDLRQTGVNERMLVAGDQRVELHSHGSNTGFRELLARRADIAMSSRPVRPEEVRASLVAGLGRLNDPSLEYVIALDGLAIIVHPDNPLRSLHLDQVRRIFSGEIDNWSRLGGRNAAIRVLARDDQSGTYDTFRSLVLGDSTLWRHALRFESASELVDQVGRDIDAIGFAGIGGIGSARALAIQDTGTMPLMPQSANVAMEDYLLTRRLYLYLRSDASPQAHAFARFAVSDAAQQAVERSGFVTQTIHAIATELPEHAPEEYRRLAQGAKRLSVNFRFGTGLSMLDSRSERDIGRLLRFVQRQAAEGQRLVLFGFADASETLPLMALALSNDRVDYVARQLLDRGIPVAFARGLGGSLPVAANDSDWGRHKNRRVEVWLTGAEIR